LHGEESGFGEDRQITLGRPHADTGRRGDVLRAGEKARLGLGWCVGFETAEGRIHCDGNIAPGRCRALEACLADPQPGRMTD
jgi:hypothetical protein